jgi:hypothetical protein
MEGSIYRQRLTGEIYERTTEMGSGAFMNTPSLTNIGSIIQKLMAGKWEENSKRRRQAGDLISLVS